MARKRLPSVIEAAEGLLPVLDGFLEARRKAVKRRALRPIEGKLEKALAKAFRAQGREFLKRFKELRDRFPVEESVTPRDWFRHFEEASLITLALFVKPLEDAVGMALLLGGQHFIAGMGVADLEFRLTNPGAVAYLDEYGARLVSKIDEETRRQLNTMITNGVQDGLSYDKLARQINAKFEQFAVGKPQAHIQSRGHLIAVTEVGNAYEESAFIAAGDLQAGGLKMEKRWVTVGDDRVSEGCQENEGEGWIAINQLHASGHQKPLRFPGCRCDEQYRRKRA